MGLDMVHILTFICLCAALLVQLLISCHRILEGWQALFSEFCLLGLLRSVHSAAKRKQLFSVKKK